MIIAHDVAITDSIDGGLENGFRLIISEQGQ